ncbi:MAG: LytR C-terminal domain-containing protein [Cryobacterium sp.]
MNTHYPKDRFDTLPHGVDRVGAHRAPAQRGRRWIGFGWALAATAVLIALGVFGMSVLNERLKPDLSGLTPGTASPAATATPKPSPTEAPVPTPKPTVDPTLSVTVLNGTLTIGLAGSVSEVLGGDGWNVGALGDAASPDIPNTVVYYAEAGLEGAARGVAESLPGAEIRLSNDFAGSGADLTVVVGNNYEPRAG